MCVCPSAMANMEVSMSLVYLKENRKINEGCFVCKIRNTDLNVEVIIDNCITRTMTLYLSFADLFGREYSSTTIEHLSHYFKHRRK